MMNANLLQTLINANIWKVETFWKLILFPGQIPLLSHTLCEKMEQCVGLENWDDINNISLAPDPQISRNNWRGASEPDHPIFSITHKSGLCSSVHTLERHADPGDSHSPSQLTSNSQQYSVHQRDIYDRWLICGLMWCQLKWFDL